MPASYAHYRFGCDVLAALPQDLQAIRTLCIISLPVVLLGLLVYLLGTKCGFQGLSGAHLPDHLCHLSSPDPDHRVLDSPHHHLELLQCPSV